MNEPTLLFDAYGQKIQREALTPRELALASISPVGLETVFGPSYTDPVTQAFGLEIFDQMYSTDAQVRACHHTKVMARLMTGWEIRSAKGGERHKKFVEYAFETMEGSVHTFLRELMEALKYGFSIIEIVWDRYKRGPWAGYLGPVALKAKPPHPFRFDTDNKGNLLKWGVRQKIASTGKDRKFPKDKFILFVYQKEPTGFYGRSDFQPVYRHFFIKMALEKWWAAYLEKYAAPTAIGKYPPGASQSEKKEVLDFLRKMQGNSAVIVPEKWAVELLEADVNSGGSESFITAINYHNKMIARGVLVPDLIQDQGERSGSYSLGQVHASNFIWVLEGLGREVETVVDEQLIRRLIDVNFSDVEEYPSFQFMGYKPSDEKAVADMFLGLVNGGIVAPDDPVIRRRLRLPADGPKPKPPVQVLPNSTPGRTPDDQRTRKPDATRTGVKPIPRDRRPTTQMAEDGAVSAEVAHVTVGGDHVHLIAVDSFGGGFALEHRHTHPIVDGVVEPVNGHTHTLQPGFGMTGLSNGHAHSISSDGLWALSIDHEHQVAGWQIYTAVGHTHGLGPQVSRAYVSIENKANRDSQKAVSVVQTGGGKPPGDGDISDGGFTEDLPDPVAEPIESIVAESFRLGREQFLGQVQRKEVLSCSDSRQLDRIRVRQLGTFKEELTELLAEAALRGAVGKLRDAEADGVLLPLPEGDPTAVGLTDALVDVYGGVATLLADKMDRIRDAAYSLAGKLGAMIQGATLTGKIGMAEDGDAAEIFAQIKATVENPAWEQDAMKAITAGVDSMTQAGSKWMQLWLDESRGANV